VGVLENVGGGFVDEAVRATRAGGRTGGRDGITHGRLLSGATAIVASQARRGTGVKFRAVRLCSRTIPA
jgi:hypothetical protein